MCSILNQQKFIELQDICKHLAQQDDFQNYRELAKRSMIVIYLLFFVQISNYACTCEAIYQGADLKCWGGIRGRINF